MKEQSATPNSGTGRPGKYRNNAPAPEVQSITTAAVAHSDDMRQRMIQYSVTMGIRMVCIGAIFIFDGWFKLVPVVGAVVLPWVAVMIANRGADFTQQGPDTLLDAAPLYAVESGALPEDDAGSSPSDILTGEIVPDEDDEATTAENSADAADVSEQSEQKDNHHEHL